MANDPNGVLYLEVDEDITSAIDRLKKAPGATVQMVTAKRSNLFQSLINLKLLHKAAKQAGKELVLVTSDNVVVNLAGRVGVAVAGQVGEAPRIPTNTPLSGTSVEDEIDGGSVGEKTPPPPATPLDTPEAEPEPESEGEPVITSDSPPTPVVKPPAKSKSQRVPNIGSMQKKLLWAGLALAVILALFGLNYYLTSATVTLYAQGKTQNATLKFTADPSGPQSSPGSGVLAAQQLTSQKTLTAQVQATGTKDEGAAAGGSMTVNNCYDTNSHTLVSGTRFAAPDGNVFVTTADTTVPAASTVFSGGHISVQPGKSTVAVQAATNGDQYNEAPTTYTIPGLPAGEQSTSCSIAGGGIYGQGSQMQGGVTKTAQVITQNDVATAQQAALAGDKSASGQALASKASSKQLALLPSLQQTVASSSPNPAVGSEAQTATLTIQVNYTMLAVQKSDLSSLAQTQESQQLGATNQIYDDGSGNIQVSAVGQPQSSGAGQFSGATTVSFGQKIDLGSIAVKLKGKKVGDAEDTATQIPGVDKADITVSPSWATSLPSITGHIHVSIKASSGS